LDAAPTIAAKRAASFGAQLCYDKQHDADEVWSDDVQMEGHALRCAISNRNLWQSIRKLIQTNRCDGRKERLSKGYEVTVTDPLLEATTRKKLNGRCAAPPQQLAVATNSASAGRSRHRWALAPHSAIPAVPTGIRL
jgi:hypothetical protein